MHSDGAGQRRLSPCAAGGCETPTTAETMAQGLHCFQMDGKAVFDTADQRGAPDHSNRCWAKSADVGIGDDVRCMLPHQPSIRILQEIAQPRGAPVGEGSRTNMDRYANTSGGTIPIVLDETWRAEKFETGDHLLFAAVGAGWTWGAALYKC